MSILHFGVLNFHSRTEKPRIRLSSSQPSPVPVHRAEQVLRRDAAKVAALLEHLCVGRRVALAAAAHALRDDARDDEQEGEHKSDGEADEHDEAASEFLA